RSISRSPVDGAGACAKAASGNAAASSATPRASVGFMAINLRIPYTQPTPGASFHADFVRELTRGVVRPAREMFGKHAAKILHGVYHGITGGLGPKVLHHQIAHALPVGVAHAGMNRLVSDDSQLAIVEGQVHEDAVAVPRLV